MEQVIEHLGPTPSTEDLIRYTMMLVGDRMTEERHVMQREILDTINSRLDKLEERLRAAERPRAQQLALLPPANEIVKLQIQYFNNETSLPPLSPVGKRSKKPNHQLKLYAWRCRRDLIADYRYGNCGDFWMSLYHPGSKEERKAHRRGLDYLGCDQAKFLGCITLSQGANRKVFEQAAVISSANWPLLHLNGQSLDCGLPKETPIGAAAGASVLTWYWPEVVAPSPLVTDHGFTDEGDADPDRE
jgi:hypothetical protein